VLDDQSGARLLRQTTPMTSDPGAGKSSMIRGLARSRDIPCETVLGSIRDPTDFAGLPVVQDGGVALWPPQWARNLREAGAGILLLDELTTCPPAVQAAMLGVALERRVGDMQLPYEVVVVACANPPDKAADGWALAPPLASRFCHVHFDPSAGEYIHGLTTGWAAPPATRAI
jgi:MoxR-like ATPase